MVSCDLAPRPVPASWPATGASRTEALERLCSVPFVGPTAEAHKRRSLGLGLLLDWLAERPGRTWQERWLSSEPGIGGPCLAQHPHDVARRPW